MGTMREHPENDLSYPADRFSRVRPEPQDFDALADEPDPAEVAERNKRSTRQAITFAASSVAITLLVGFVLKAIPGISENTWAVLTSIPPVVALLACAVIMVRKLNRYERWIPWMGVFWLPIVPFTMWWLTVTIGMLALDATH